MSLINKMLKDLEARQSHSHRPDPQSIYHGLRSASQPPANRRRTVALVLVGALALAGFGGWVAWQRLVRSVPELAVVPADRPPAPSAAAVATPAGPAATPRVRQPTATTRGSARPVRSEPVPPGSGTAAIDITGHPVTRDDQAENKYREAVNLIRQARAEDAEQRLRAALSLDPLHVAARETLAALLVGQGRWLEAQALLEDGLQRLPDQLSFGFLLARLYVEQGKDAAGLQLLERLEPKSAGEPGYAAFMATLYQRTGRHGEAVKYYRQATAARPTEGRWWAGLGISLEAENDREAARAAYQRASMLVLDPRLAAYVADRQKQLSSR